MKRDTIHNALKLHVANELTNNSKRLLLAIFGLFCLAMYIPLPNLGSEGLGLAYNFGAWLAFAVILSLGFWQLATQNQLQYSNFTLSLFISCTLMSVPMLYPAADWQASYQRIVALWSGWLFIFLLQQFNFKNRRQVLLWFVVFAALIEISLNYTQQLFTGLALPFTTWQGSARFGSFMRAEHSASFIATGVAVATFLLPLQTQFWSRLLLLSLPCLSLPLLLTLEANGAVVAIALSLGLLTPYCLQYLKNKTCLAWFTSIALGIVAAHALHAQHNQTPLTLWQQLKVQPAEQVAEQQLSHQLIDMAAEKPLIGLGYGNFEQQYRQLTDQWHQQNSFYPAGFQGIQHPNNELLLWFIEGGLLALAGIILAAGALFIQICYAAKTKKLALAALFVPIAINAQYDDLFSFSFVHWLVLMLLLWWCDGMSKLRFYRLKSASRRVQKLCAVIMPLTIISFLLVSFWNGYALVKQG